MKRHRSIILLNYESYKIRTWDLQPAFVSGQSHPKVCGEALDVAHDC